MAIVKNRFPWLRVLWLSIFLLLGPALSIGTQTADDETDAPTTALNDQGLCLNDDGSGDSETCGNDITEGALNGNAVPSRTELCHSQFSQTSLAMAMSQQSSPRNSPSHRKLKHILSQYPRFHIDLGGDSHQGLFDAVVDNMATALEGYGLTRAASMDDGMLRVEALFSSHRKTRGDTREPLYIQQSNMAVIILQTEQICCTQYGQRMLPYMHLCHASPHCMIWEYAPRNWEWLVQHGLGDSVLLLPLLHQHRLNSYYYDDHTASDDVDAAGEDTSTDNDQEATTFKTLEETSQLTPLQERPIDVVFFGVMTPRRKQLQEQLATIAAQQQWKIVVEEVANSGSRLEYMAQSYRQSKICLIWHSFFVAEGSHNHNPGEYHRLSELAPSGCVPVVETFGDVLVTTSNDSSDAMNDYYGHCGGVLFADLDQLVPMLQLVLYSINNNHIRLQDVLGDSWPELAAKVDGLPTMEERLAWWNDAIQWDRVLAMILDGNDTDDSAEVSIGA